jgi:hypothetical protein
MSWRRRAVLAGPARAPFGLAARQRPRIVPGAAPLGIECLGGPGHHVKRVRTTDRGRAALGHHVGDPVRSISGHMGDLRSALSAERIEEPPQGGGVAARRGPHQPTRVVIDDHRDSVESKLSSSPGFPGSDLHDRQHGHGRRRAELTRGGSSGSGYVGEPIEQCGDGGVSVVDGGAFVVGERDAGEHALQVVAGLEQLGFGGVFGGVEIATGASYSVRALFEEAVGAPAVAEVVVLPGFSGSGCAGCGGVAVDEDLDGADVAGEVSGFGVGLGQRVRGDLGVMLGGVGGAVFDIRVICGLVDGPVKRGW